MICAVGATRWTMPATMVPWPKAAYCGCERLVPDNWSRTAAVDWFTIRGDAKGPMEDWLRGINAGVNNRDNTRTGNVESGLRVWQTDNRTRCLGDVAVRDGNAKVVHRGCVGEAAGRRCACRLEDFQQSVEFGVGNSRLATKDLQKGAGIDQSRRGDEEKLSDAAIQ